jgi:hypothetical protein
MSDGETGRELDGQGLKPGRPARASTRAASRWVTRCQYHQVPTSTRLPPRELAVPVSRSILSLLEQLDLADCCRRWSLETRWNELVGKPLCEYCRPGTVREGRLTLLVRHSTWRYEIERHLAGPLLRKLQTACPELGIRELSVRLDSQPADRPAARPAPRTP